VHASTAADVLAALGNDLADHLDQREHHGSSENTPTVVRRAAA
jgi:hypothetical protein